MMIVSFLVMCLIRVEYRLMMCGVSLFLIISILVSRNRGIVSSVKLLILVIICCVMIIIGVRFVIVR